MTNKLKNSFECKYCKKSFKKESTIAVHLCEPKRRWLQEKEQGPRIGLMAYLRFIELNQTNGNKKKTYADFAKSNYYKAFVRFGWHCIELRVINVAGFIDYLIKDGIKLDWWAKDRYYEKYLIGVIKTEHSQDALIRSIHEIQRWANENEKDFDRFFVDASPNHIATMLINGRISPWIIYGCQTGTAVLDNFEASELGSVFGFIDPDYWGEKFKKYPEDIEWVKNMLKETGFDSHET